MSRIDFWQYSLESASGLNSVSQRTRHEGALIRVDGGYGCIHPWPELGDLPLAEQLRLLREGGDSPLVRSALACTAIDGEARRAGRHLIDKDTQPLNHRLAKLEDDPAEFREAGFEKVKLKVGPDLEGSVALVDRWASHGFQVRLDANESIPFLHWLGWWSELSEEHRKAIDFVEDPCSWSSLRWRLLRATGMPIAGDREVEQRYRASTVAVYKPATDSSAIDGSDGLDTNLISWALKYQRRLVVTSYMDHAVGQAWAAYCAGCFEAVAPGVLDHCGLLTHDRFAEDEFFEQIGVDRARYDPASGTGLGFDDLLENLPWKPLA